MPCHITKLHICCTRVLQDTASGARPNTSYRLLRTTVMKVVLLLIRYIDYHRLLLLCSAASILALLLPRHAVFRRGAIWQPHSKAETSPIRHDDQGWLGLFLPPPPGCLRG